MNERHYSTATNDRAQAHQNDRTQAYYSGRTQQATAASAADAVRAVLQIDRRGHAD